MLKFLKTRLLDWLGMALLIAFATGVLPIWLSDGDMQEMESPSFDLVFVFVAAYIGMDLALRSTRFLLRKYRSDRLDKYLKQFGIGLEKPEQDAKG